MPRKTPEGRWLVDLRPEGSRGRRIRKLFNSKAEAIRFEAHLKNQSILGKPWNPSDSDRRKLSTLCNTWFELHGRSLKDGPRRLQLLLAMCDRLGDPQAAHFSAKDFTTYRAARVQEVTENTINHEHAYLRAVFNELQRLGEFHGKNPLANVRQFRLDESELVYLEKEQAEILVAAADPSVGRNPHTQLVILVCLATGARWSEAQDLRIDQLQGGRISLSKTKSGKRRTIPIDNALEARLRAHRDAFRLPGKRIFSSCYAAFGKAVQRAGLDLPKGQLSHVLRHTFASHFMMMGGNILVLQRILGHTDIKQTMRYSHFSPDHLEQARSLNITGHLLDTEHKARFSDK